MWAFLILPTSIQCLQRQDAAIQARGKGLILNARKADLENEVLYVYLNSLSKGSSLGDQYCEMVQHPITGASEVRWMTNRIKWT